MNCPSCPDQALDERFTHGIEVDICPKCKGIWLDRGELERVANGLSPEAAVLATSNHDNPVDARHDEAGAGDGREETAPEEARPKTRSDSPEKATSEKKKSRTKGRRERLGDLIEDVLDEVFDFD